VGTKTIEWRDQRVPTVKVESMGSYKGPGGLSGLVTVWITDDERALPVRAKMKVSVGPVTLTLLPEPADERPPHASLTPAGPGHGAVGE